MIKSLWSVINGREKIFYVGCVFCGEVQEADQSTPIKKRALDHMAHCKDHPIFKLEIMLALEREKNFCLSQKIKSLESHG